MSPVSTWMGDCLVECAVAEPLEPSPWQRKRTREALVQEHPRYKLHPLCQGHVTKPGSVQPRSEFSCAKEKANNNFHPPTMPLHHWRNKGATWWRSPWQLTRVTRVTNHQGRHMTGHMTGPHDLSHDTNNTGTARADKKANTIGLITVI